MTQIIKTPDKPNYPLEVSATQFVQYKSIQIRLDRIVVCDTNCINNIGFNESIRLANIMCDALNKDGRV